jgi:protein SCO1
MNHPISGRQCQAAFTCCLLPATLAGMIFNAGCAAGPDRAASGPPPCCTQTLAAPTSVSDKSLYQLDSLWTNDQHATRKLGALRGRPQLITMFFTSCGYACPVLVHDMKQIEAALPANARTNVGFTLVSFDTERDTPAALAAYRQTHGLAANWTLLHGAADDVLELAALLGVKFKQDPRGDFAHSNLITVLDADGEIVMQQVGLNQEAAPTAAALQKLLESGRP